MILIQNRNDWASLRNALITLELLADGEHVSRSDILEAVQRLRARVEARALEPTFDDVLSHGDDPC